MGGDQCGGPQSSVVDETPGAFVTITRYIRARAKVVQHGRQRPECHVRVRRMGSSYNGKRRWWLARAWWKTGSNAQQGCSRRDEHLNVPGHEGVFLLAVALAEIIHCRRGGRKESTGCSILLDYMRAIHQPSGGSSLLRVRAWWHG